MTDMTDAKDSEALASGSAGRHDTLSSRDPEGPGDAQAPSPTAVFAQRRIELGLSLDDIANQLKFSARQIEALEAGDFEKLPGGTFARGMMRNYARLLKVDPAQILAQLAASGASRQTALDQAVSLRTPIPFSEGGKHVNLVYVILSIVILALVAFFAIEWYLERPGAGKLAFVLPVTQESPVTPVVPAMPSFAERKPPAVTVAGSGGTPARETATRAEDKAVARSADKTVESTLSFAAGKRRIVLRFDGESWVEIKTARGATLLSQINPAGSEKMIEGAPPFSLTIGNAARVHLTYNDMPVDLRPHQHLDVARLTLN